MDLKAKLKELSECEANVETCASAIRRAQETKAINQARVDAIKAEIRLYMQENGIKRDEVQDGDYKLYVTLMDGKDKVSCPDIDAVPDEFVKVEKKEKKKEIEAYIKESGTLPNWAVIEKGEPYIVIKAGR